MRVGVFGAGLIGGYLGICLSGAGLDVTLITRRKPPLPPERWRAYPSRHREVHASTSLVCSQDPEALTHVEVCLVTVKAPDTPAAAETLRHVLPTDALVISFQNGLSSAIRLEAALGRHRVARGVVGFNVVRRSDAWVRASRGSLVVAAKRGRHLRDLRTLARAFRRSHQRMRLRHDIDAVMAGKLLMNLNNGICAATGLSIVDSLRDRHARRLLARCIAEGILVLRRSGVRPARVGVLGPAAMVRALRLPDAILRGLAPLVGGVAADARSSTLVDLESGKRTEIDEFNGYIATHARALGIDAPANRMVTEAVHALEATSRSGRCVRYADAGELWRTVEGSARHGPG